MASRGAWANLPPPTVASEALPPLAPSQKKKWPKAAIVGKFLDFCPLRNAFCPLDAPQKRRKNLVPPLLRAGIDSGECTPNLASSFRKRYSY